MIRPTMTIATLALLAACGSDYAGNIGSDPIPVSVFGATTAAPTMTGAFPGISASDTTVVSDRAGNGYAFAYAGVNAADFGTGSGQADLAVAGVLPGSDVGSLPAVGSATMTGSYQMVLVENASTATDPSTWTVTRPTGTMTAQVNFGSGVMTGSSADGALTLSAAGDPGFSGGFAGDVVYNGESGRFAGVLGADTAIAAFAGQGSDTFYAGGFTLTD